MAQPDKKLIFRSEKMQQVLTTLEMIAPSNVTVLIQGESGTGKELIARTIHQKSTRNNRPFIAVNCAALPETILESELFGHEKGAFTDAKEQRKGRFELADTGTLFLDEIGDMTLATQVKLLRVLEENELMRLGGTRPISIDTRIIAATNKNLEQAVLDGEFRRDLFYRLKVITLELPPLRERTEDIPPLVDAFIREFCVQNNLDFPGITPEAMDVLTRYPWPGNVRELQNLVKNLIILSPDKKVGTGQLPKYLWEQRGTGSDRLPVRLNKTTDQAERELIYRAVLEIKHELADLKRIMTTPVEKETGPESRSLADMEKERIAAALRQHHFNKKKAADELGIGERTIYRKIKKYGLE